MVHPRVRQNMRGVHHYHKHIDPLMRGAIEREVVPRFELLVNNMQQQKSH